MIEVEVCCASCWRRVFEVFFWGKLFFGDEGIDEDLAVVF